MFYDLFLTKTSRRKHNNEVEEKQIEEKNKTKFFMWFLQISMKKRNEVTAKAH